MWYCIQNSGELFELNLCGVVVFLFVFRISALLSISLPRTAIRGSSKYVSYLRFLCQGEIHSKSPYLSTWNYWVFFSFFLFIKKEAPWSGENISTHTRVWPSHEWLFLFLYVGYLLYIWYPAQGRNSLLSTRTRTQRTLLEILGLVYGATDGALWGPGKLLVIKWLRRKRKHELLVPRQWCRRRGQLWERQRDALQKGWFPRMIPRGVLFLVLSDSIMWIRHSHILWLWHTCCSDTNLPKREIFEISLTKIIHSEAISL